MFRELFLFELYYRKRRATTYVYFFLVFIVAFLFVTSPTLEVGAGRSGNASYIIAAITIVCSIFLTIITAGVMGVAIVRDFDSDISSILFTTPINKTAYLFGRLTGSMAVTVFLHLAIIPGMMAGYLIGPHLPWEVAWKSREMMPFDVWVYVQPFLMFELTTIFITGSIFFCVGALVKKPIVIYTQSIILLAIYQIANIFFLSDPDSQRMAAIIDPLAIHTFAYVARYWTPVQQDTLLVPFDDVMLINRLGWIAIAILTLLVTWWRFSFTTRKGLIRSKKIDLPVSTIVVSDVVIPVVRPTGGIFPKVIQVVHTSLFYFRGIWREVPFLAIAGTGLIVLIVNAAKMDQMYGTSSYPTTQAILTMFSSFTIFFLILLIFYSGEMVWKEAQIKINPIVDATPAPSGLILLSKFISLALTFFSFLFGFMIFGILLQVSKGYHDVDIKAYVGTLFLDSFISVCMLTVVTLLIQVLTGNKFLGFVVTVAFMLFVAFMGAFGVEHDLISFGSGSLGVFSEMNGFGHFVRPFTWLKTYWIAFAFLIFIPAVIFYRRGTENGFRMKWKAGKSRFTGGFRLVSIAAAIVYIASGIYIYYNTSVLNHFETTGEMKTRQSRYEKELKKFESTPQPKITEVNLKVDLFPELRSFKATGYYYLRNRDSLPIGQIQLQHMNSSSLELHDVSFGRQATIVENRKDFGYQVYDITPPLEPGDSLRMDFAVDFIQKGFKGKGSNTDLVYNGTFFRNNYFPTIGYDRNRELTGGDDRKRFALNARNPGSPNADKASMNAFGKDADRIRFKAQVSTDSSQVAIAPGEMVKEWYENDRHYQQYEAKSTIPDFYAILSGKYKIAHDKWNDVSLEIYYHPAHNYNVERMMQGLKDGLTYYTKSFGPFPHSQLKIVEFPRYSTLAQSFPGMIAFSEGAGFILRISDPTKDLDVPYYVTAHELAHQWWGQQVMEADQLGKAMLSEGMAQYSALMVMTQAFPVETMQLFLKYELTAYLKGRSAEKMSEVTLLSVRDQQYISYHKSALAFFAIQDYIGEDSLNAAFSRFYKKWSFKGPPYPSSDDLVREIRTVTPDSLQYLISDLFDYVTLYEIQTQEAAYRGLSQGRFEVTMTVSTEKLQVDGKGKEVGVPINDWIDIGVYGNDENGKEKLIYLKKHKFNKLKSTLIIITQSEPTRVGIDPLHKLVDHHIVDNVIPVGTVVDLATSPLN
ncbi:MAG TPA: M1 family aminopeptidase [Cyclobacteriaceae bacterium]|nr:M1 family aminopeptidase [Cyclobacteriaceae bacterium]